MTVLARSDANLKGVNFQAYLLPWSV